MIPTFYDRNTDGLPVDWIDRMRAAMTELPPAFSAKRMVLDYVDEMYRTDG